MALLDQGASGPGVGQTPEDNYEDALDSFPSEPFHDVSFDKSVYEDLPDTFDVPVDGDTQRSLEAGKNDIAAKYNKVHEFEILECEASDAGDYIQDDPFVPEEIYYTKAMNPRAVGTVLLRR